MKKTISLLIVPIVVLSIVSGLLFNQLVIVQNENSELKNEFFEVNIQLEEEQNASFQLESQINELQNQTEQLEDLLTELENERNELEEQLSRATDIVKITDFTLNGTTFPVVGAGWQSDFVVTVENFGINDVENITVFFNVQAHFLKTGDGWELRNHSITIGNVKKGESKTVHQWIHHGVYDTFFVATLMMNDIFLDNRTTVLTW